ncbi:MAG: beta-propeller domain-containing protein [Deltaproteobacteria bacterium]|nr:beta-propeller domain-containing protein [Deltaproteobacteria bacterium]
MVSCGGVGSGPSVLTEVPEYTSQAPSSAGTWNSRGQAEGGGVLVDGTAAPTVGGSDKSGTTTAVVPGGRVADVQEADVYRIQDGKLFLLNTYRGFLVFDIANPKQPVRLAQLPVYGYPVEMFVEKNTVYALLSDALYLTQVAGKLQFERRNTSQIVTIDISDPAQPRLLQAMDIAGQLREGVSRKIENTIYVVSYQPSGYWYYGWGPQNGEQPDEAAWVYSYDASTPSNLKQVGQLQVFQGGQSDSYDQVTGESHSRYSQGVTLSATANAIMVVQNWYTYDYVPPNTSATTPGGAGREYDCGVSESDQESVVSIVDVSNPTGVIRVAASFEVAGALGDQFKQTYVWDAAANTGTYLGIFARSSWTSDALCNYTQQTQNTLSAWDIVGDGTARQLSSIDFGKPNETVRGSYFDADRKVVFAITARAMDPMYAISFADRNKLAILSEIDGLSGDMDLFRPVEGGQYLLAVGRDTGSACAGYVSGADAGETWSDQIAVSLIDVRDLGNIRLVQRKCLDVAGAGWVGSQVTWNLDQAHKLIGLHSDGKTNVLTVPISYGVQSDSGNGWYWYRWETAVGIVSWDLGQYQPGQSPEQQKVIATHGRFVHPNGEVNRSVLFAQGADQHREMLNISDTHLSLANLQDLDNPVLDAVVEVAPADAAVYRFGDYLVEQVALQNSDYSQVGYEFRVKKAGGELEQTPTVATFSVGQVQQVLRHGNLLVLFRQESKETTDSSGMPTITYNSKVLVYDLSDPTAPKPAGTLDLPTDLSPYNYYRYYCGVVGYYGGYYFDYVQSQISLGEGIAFLVWSGDYVSKTVRLPDGSATTQSEWAYKHTLAFLDLRNPAKPAIATQALSLPVPAGASVDSASLVADGMSPSGLYISYRARIGSTYDAQTSSTLYTYAGYAQRWQRSGGAWQSEGAINLPGNLVRTFAGAGGQRMFLTRDDIYTSKHIDNYRQWFDNVNLKLLRQVEVDGRVGAELLDTRLFEETSPKSMVFDGDRMYLATGIGSYYYYAETRGGVGIAVDTASGGAAAAAGEAGSTEPADTSDRLAIIDMSQGQLALTYDQPTALYNLDLMGVQQNKLFVNLQGDGILIVDVANPAAPKGMAFKRTLGWPSGIEFAGASAYLPAYNYGTYRIDLTAPGNL